MEQSPDCPNGAPEEEDDDYQERWTDLLGYVHELRSEPDAGLQEMDQEGAADQVGPV